MLEYIKPTPKRRRRVLDQIVSEDGNAMTVLYTRGSTKEINHDNQVREFNKKYPDLHYQHFAETASGAKDRPILKWLIETLPPQSTLHVVAIDRLSRGLLDLQMLLARAKEREITVMSMREHDMLQNPLFIPLLGIVAEMERNNIKERIKAGVKRVKMERGLGEKVWGRAIRKAQCEKTGEKYVARGVRQMRPEFSAAIPEIKALRKKKFTLKEIAAICTQKYKVNFTVPNISNLSRHGKHG